jgi:thymidine kinase
MSTSGNLTVICGPMFSSKTRTLIELIIFAVYSKKKVMVIRPTIDNRYGDGIKSHDNQDLEQMTGIKPIIVKPDLSDLIIPDDVEVVAFEEVPFFIEKVVDVIETLIYNGKEVIAVGLDLWANGKPANNMGILLPLADVPIKRKAVCVVCHKPATRSYRKVAVESDIFVGGAESYEARCKTCWKLAT